MESFLEIIVSVRSALNEHVVFAVGFLLFVGYFFGKVAQRLKLPVISGYILAGLILGESVTSIIDKEMTGTLHIVTEVALGIVALTIGGEFGLTKVGRLGKGILFMTIGEIFGALIIVTFAMWLFSWPLKYAVLFGSIAGATAPAATIVIIQELKARGEFVDLIYGVVALDDAFCVLVFSATFALFGVSLGQKVSIVGAVSGAIWEIGLSLIVGVIGGLILHLLTFRRASENEMLVLSLATVFLVNAVSVSLGVSLLLANMMTGATIANLSNKSNRVMQSIGRITPPVYAAFFIIAGTELDLGLDGGLTTLLYAILYFVARGIGEYSGFFLGAMVSGLSKKVQKYIGLCSLPQAGVAIGLAMFLQTSPVTASAPPEVKVAFTQMANIILFSVLINELIGPPISKYGIIKGAEL